MAPEQKTQQRQGNQIELYLRRKNARTLACGLDRSHLMWQHWISSFRHASLVLSTYGETAPPQALLKCVSLDWRFGKRCDNHSDNGFR